MSTNEELLSLCEQIKLNYSPCDVSDCLLQLQVPSAGFLKDILPFPDNQSAPARLVAPISTVLFVPRSHSSTAIATPLTPIPNLPSTVPQVSNLPPDKHFTDLAPPGSVVLMQQPSDQIVALVGDIVATRYLTRGIKGVFIDGRGRDVVGINELCSAGAGGEFQVWAKGLSSVGTSLQAKPWAVDVEIDVAGTLVRAGDVLVADRGERVACVIPRERLREAVELLPRLKEADDGLLGDVRKGVDFKAALRRWPEHYSNH